MAARRYLRGPGARLGDSVLQSEVRERKARDLALAIDSIVAVSLRNTLSNIERSIG